LRFGRPRPGSASRQLKSAAKSRPNFVGRISRWQVNLVAKKVAL
jgi:hypothetical protein